LRVFNHWSTSTLGLHVGLEGRAVVVKLQSLLILDLFSFIFFGEL